MNVYKEVIEKICNARFGELIQNYNELNHLKEGKLNFRGSLNASNILNGGKEKTSSRKAPAAAKGSSAPTANGAPANAPLAIAPASSAITSLRPGMNGVVADRILNGLTFRVSGLFDEVNSDAAAAIRSISDMIIQFGGKVNDRTTKATSKCLFFFFFYYCILYIATASS